MKYKICQVESKGVEMPYCIIYKIGQGDKQAVTEFPGNFEIIFGKKCRKVLPVLYVRIARNDPEVIEHKLMVKRIQVRKKCNQRYQDGQENSDGFG